MRTTLIRAGWVVALVALGWIGGRAQDRPEPQFVLDVEAPQGWTKIVCVRGCELVAARSATSAKRTPEFTYGCGVHGTPDAPQPQPASGSLRCRGTALGWIAPSR
jgi:hypothetical protein